MTTITGIIPAAGTASRLGGLPKMLLPCPDGHLLGALSRRMTLAGASKVWIGASKASEPMIKPYASGEMLSVVVGSQNMAQTVLAGRKAAGDSVVLLGMPDTYWQAQDVYQKLLHRILEFDAEVAVALWHIRHDQRGSLGQVEAHGDYCRRIVDKDEACPLPWVWGAIAWRPSFWEHITPDMAHVGMALQSAIDAGIKVWPVEMDGDYWDCGSWDSYSLMCAMTTGAQIYVR